LPRRGGSDYTAGMPSQRYDCLVVGRGIVGLAHARAAARAGLRVAVIDRETRSVGASIRNFGFITVTGQPAGLTWRRARRSRDIWAEIAPRAGIAVLQRGLLTCARRAEAMTVLREFAAGPMGEGCRVLSRGELPAGLGGSLEGALHSPHELRVESRDAVPRLAAYLADAHGVEFLPRAAVLGVETGRVHTARGALSADSIVVCPGTDLVSLFPDEMERRGVTLCKLHMMRLAAPGIRLPAPLMSDLSLVRYGGYATASLPQLRARLQAEQPACLAHGVHLIVVQGEDGSLVVGDSHHYGHSPDPFQPEAVDRLILDELAAVAALAQTPVVERWVGVYPSGPEPAFIAAPAPGVRLVQVTSGTGASTAFALAEETIADLMGHAPPAHARQAEDAQVQDALAQDAMV
jgi:FAD dependent oxidoreductase TIGR03364